MSVAFSALRRLRQSEPGARHIGAGATQPVGERCELCAQPVHADHGHVVDLEDRSLLCTCDPCHLLFAREQADHGRFRAVPRRHRPAVDVELTAQQWERLQIPVGLSFVFRNSRLGRLALFYPGPAGATESLLETEAWVEVLAAVPGAADLADDVEALLLRRVRERTECCLVPVDACYRLIGRIRRDWRGFDGGQQVRAEIDRFFAQLREPGAALRSAKAEGGERS
jgi:uncharacterized protein DUF5947